MFAKSVLFKKQERSSASIFVSTISKRQENSNNNNIPWLIFLGQVAMDTFQKILWSSKISRKNRKWTILLYRSYWLTLNLTWRVWNRLNGLEIYCLFSCFEKATKQNLSFVSFKGREERLQRRTLHFVKLRSFSLHLKPSCLLVSHSQLLWTTR